MKKFDLIFAAILVPVDFLMIVLAAISAYFLRFAPVVTEIRPVIFNLPFQEYLAIAIFIAILWLILFAFSGLYRIKDNKNPAQEFYKIFLACSAGIMLVMVLIFARRELFSSRFIVLAVWIFSVIYVSIGHLAISWLQTFFRRRGYGARKVLLIGADRIAEIIAQEIKQKPEIGYRLVGAIKNYSPDIISQVKKILTEHPDLYQIIQSKNGLPQEASLKLVEFCDENHLVFKYTPDLFETQSINIEVGTLAGIPIMELRRTRLEGWGRIIKRLFDVIGSTILIILASPFMFFMALAIKFDSRGPVFFSRYDDGERLKRVGEHGQLFNYFKFRSMRPGTHNMRYRELADLNSRSDGPLVKIKNDPRVTRVGRILRRYSFDELPELFLVFIGKMSLVGPRPHFPEEVEKYQRHHKKTLMIKPGITGLAQISGRSNLSFEDEVRLDAYYIENWSLMLDLQILFKTPLAVIKYHKNC